MENPPSLPLDMDQKYFRRLETMFHAALQLPRGFERDAFLERECTGKPEAHSQVLALIQADEQPVFAPAAVTEESPAPAELPSFGVFQADEILGRGGSGVVYLAHRTDGHFEQAVAVKALLPEAAAGVFHEGFLRERRILAALHHPGIAQVLDGGFRPDGAPYLVMEYIEGRRIDTYCRERRLSLSERIALFLTVCDAVAFAHRHLVVHLDLKPSNILVTADGRAKLLDFGTAKILDASDNSVTQSMATPRYASPEQLRGERASVASDIYSLGIVLAELVTGKWPLGDPDSRIQTLRRAAENVPPRPLAPQVTAEQAVSCRMPLSQLQRAISGDLGAVLLKALEAQPDRRYRSVDEFAQDLRNFAAGLPVLARPQTHSYRAARFLQRNRGAVASASLVALVILVLGAYAWIQQRRSVEEGRRAQQLNSYLMRLLQSTNPSFGGRRDQTVGELVELALSQADSMLADQPAAKAELGLMAGGHQVFTSGLSAATATLSSAVDAARRSGDPGILAATLAYKSALEGEGGACPAAVADMGEATRLVDRNAARIRREWLVTHAFNRAVVASWCGATHDESVALAGKALELARSIPENSLEESTPPAILRSFALLLSALNEGCAAGESRRAEAFGILERHGGLLYAEAALWRQRGLCSVRGGRFEDGAAELGKAVDLEVRSLGAAYPETLELRGEYAYALALARKPEAVAEARLALNTAECSRWPADCDQAQSYAAQALAAMDHGDEARPALDRLTGKPAFAPAVETCRFVIAAGRGLANESDREAAQKFKDRVPAGSLWRQKIEAALAASAHR